MQLSFMWMLKYLLLGRERQQWQEGPETPRPHHQQLIKKKGLQSYNWYFNSNPFSQVIGSNPRPLAAALSRETDKINKYAADCNRLNLTFHPLWWISMVRFHPTQCSMFSIPSSTGLRTLCHQTELHPPTAKAYWYQRLSVTLWTFNTYMVKPQSGIY